MFPSIWWKTQVRSTSITSPDIGMSGDSEVKIEINSEISESTNPNKICTRAILPPVHEEKMNSSKNGNKPFKYNVCGDSFSQERDLNRHIESVHENKNTFECSICDTSFTEKQSLNGHIESVHKGKKQFFLKKHI